jgi:hypothetical protein
MADWNAAYRAFEEEISNMGSDEFWAMLGTSIEELRAKQEPDYQEKERGGLFG